MSEIQAVVVAAISSGLISGIGAIIANTFTSKTNNAILAVKLDALEKKYSAIDRVILDVNSLQIKQIGMGTSLDNLKEVVYSCPDCTKGRLNNV